MIIDGLLLIAAVVMCCVLPKMKLIFSKTTKVITGQFPFQINNTIELTTHDYIENPYRFGDAGIL